MLAHCWAESPFYRELWTRAGVPSGSSRLIDLPVIDKRAVVDAGERLVDPVRLGPGATSDRTSGSSGLILAVPTDPAAARVKAAIWHRAHLAYGFTPRRRMAFFRFSAGTPGIADRLGVWRSTWIDAEQDVQSRFDRLRALAPDIVAGYPSHLLDLCRGIDHADLRALRVDAVVSGSETLTASARDQLATAFGAPVFDLYGAFEFGNIAYECRAGSRHLSIDAVYPEVLDENGQRCAPGQTGDLVLTGLLNRALPLIRYRIGDRGALMPGGCRCGRGSPLLAALAGRSDDALVGHGHRLSQAAVGEVFKRLPQITAYQARQGADLAVSVGLLLTCDVAEEDVVCAQAADLLRAHLGGVPVTCRRVDVMPRDASGKVRPVATEVGRDEGWR